jgi:hypothetical protein
MGKPKDECIHTKCKRSHKIFEWPVEPSKLDESFQFFLELLEESLNYIELLVPPKNDKKFKINHPYIHK